MLYYSTVQAYWTTSNQMNSKLPFDSLFITERCDNDSGHNSQSIGSMLT